MSSGRVPQKRIDALAMLRVIRDHLAAAPPRRPMGHRFEHTDAWESLLRQVHGDAPRAG